MVYMEDLHKVILFLLMISLKSPMRMSREAVREVVVAKVAEAVVAAEEDARGVKDVRGVVKVVEVRVEVEVETRIRQIACSKNLWVSPKNTRWFFS